jgi:hypothetical protein
MPWGRHVELTALPNIKVRVEAQHAIPSLNFHDLWENITFFAHGIPMKIRELSLCRRIEIEMTFNQATNRMDEI